MNKLDISKLVMSRRSKGISMRFIALLLLLALVIIVVAFIFFYYAPNLFDALVDIILNPPEEI